MWKSYEQRHGHPHAQELHTHRLCTELTSDVTDMNQIKQEPEDQGLKVIDPSQINPEFFVMDSTKVKEEADDDCQVTQIEITPLTKITEKQSQTVLSLLENTCDMIGDIDIKYELIYDHHEMDTFKCESPVPTTDTYQFESLMPGREQEMVDVNKERANASVHAGYSFSPLLTKHLSSHSHDVTNSDSNQVSSSITPRENQILVRSNTFNLLTKCTTCFNVFQNVVLFLRHITDTHPEVKHYDCYRCGQQFVTIASFNEHLTKNNICKRPFRCMQCGLCFNSSDVRRSHSCQHKWHLPLPYQCSVCNLTFNRFYWLTDHMCTHPHHTHHKGAYKCSQCCQRFEEPYMLSDHYHNKHVHFYGNYFRKAQFPEPTGRSTGVSEDIQSQLTMCTTCLSVFHKVHLLLAHITEKHPEVNCYDCYRCGEEFEAANTFTKHLNLETGICKQTFRCGRCGLCFNSSDICKRHSAQHDSHLLLPYMCSLCHLTFNRLYWIADHIKTHSQKVAYTCFVCGDKFDEAQLLSAHYYQNHQDFYEMQYRKARLPLQYCGLTGHEDSYIHPWKRQNFMQDQLATCTTCLGEFNEVDTLLIHIKDSHPRVNCYDCFRCGNQFRNINSFTAHLNEQNDCKRLFRCARCGLCFNGYILMKIHTLQHDNSRLPLDYQCSSCHWTCSRIYWLMKHLQTMH